MHGYPDGVVLREGPGWRSARLAYAGRQLAMTMVLPTGALEDLESRLDANALNAMTGGPAPTQRVEMALPRWKFRLAAPLKAPLSDLGMPTAFDDVKADFSGMTHDEELYIKEVLHQGFIAVDEKSTEAAAATAVLAEAGSARPDPPPRFIVDRPFLFVVHDVDTATPLFIGRVIDPTAE